MWGPTPYAMFHDMVDDVTNSVTPGTKRGETATSRITSLENRLERMLLVNVAMWELLKERTGLSEEELVAKVEEVDLRDGTADGKMAKTVAECPQCGRRMSPRHQRCLYCGYEDLNKTAHNRV